MASPWHRPVETTGGSLDPRWWDNQPPDYGLWVFLTLPDETQLEVRAYELDELRRLIDILAEYFFGQLKAVAPKEQTLRLYEQGLTYKQIAAALGIPLGTVKSRIHYARKHRAKPEWTSPTVADRDLIGVNVVGWCEASYADATDAEDLIGEWGELLDIKREAMERDAEDGDDE